MPLIEKDADQKPSFEELQRAAEQEAGVPADTEMYGEFLQDVNQGDPGDEQPEPEPEPEPTPEAEPEVEPEPEVEAAPDPAAELAEIKQKLGQLLNENAELRRAQAEPEPQQQVPVAPLTDVGWFDEFTEGDPANAATWALQNGQTHLFDRAIRTWYEQDPVAAGRFERQVEQAVLLQNVQQSIQPQVATANEYANRAKLETAMQTVSARHPDFQEVMIDSKPEDVENIFGSGPLKELMNSSLAGDLAATEQVFETIYNFRKAAKADLLIQAAREAPQRQSDEAREARREAFVGSASTTTPDEVPETEAERLARVWKESDRSMRAAWTGQDSRRR